MAVKAELGQIPGEGATDEDKSNTLPPCIAGGLYNVVIGWLCAPRVQHGLGAKLLTLFPWSIAYLGGGQFFLLRAPSVSKARRVSCFRAPSRYSSKEEWTERSHVLAPCLPPFHSVRVASNSPTRPTAV